MKAWPAPDRPLPVAVFGFDLAEASQIRRIRSLIALGCEVTSFCQRRAGSPDFTPEWVNVDLGEVRHNDMKGRALRMAGSVRRAVTERDRLAQARIIIARNLDLALIAQAARHLAAIRTGGRPAPLVYECLDIHGMMTRPDIAGRIMRRAERHILRQSALLVVSSPGFVENYFGPVQNHRGPTALVENKLWLGLDPAAAPPRPAGGPRPDRPLTIGLIGSIRCQKSVDLLLAVADRLGPALQLRFSGQLHDHAVSGFHQAVAARDNVEWTGPYAYPQDLARIYAGCDLVWAQDLWQAGTNSDWLLPNRIYEAGWCGCPPVAVADTQTGRRIVAEGLGFVIERADPDLLADFLTQLPGPRLHEARQRLLARPASDFVLSPGDLRPMLAPVMGFDDAGFDGAVTKV